MKKLVYYGLLALALLLVLRALLPQRSSTEISISDFGQLPVQLGGRIQPLDTVARNALLILSNRQKVVTREDQTLAPIVWLIDLTMRPALADTYPIFKIEYPDDLGFTGLAKPGIRYYSYNELKPHFESLDKAYATINPEAQLRTAYEKQVYELVRGRLLYYQLQHSLRPPEANDNRLDRLIDEYKSYQVLAKGAGTAELLKQVDGESYDAELLNQFIVYLDAYTMLNYFAYFDSVPPPGSASVMDDWNNIGYDLLEVMKGKALSPVVSLYGSMIMAYRANDAVRFNQDIDDLKTYFVENTDVNQSKIAFEQWFNHFQPFYVAMQLYVLIFFIVCVSWLCWPASLGKAAYYSLILAFFIHSFGLLARMYIQGRPPVTNLYSSAIFVGWGAVLLGMFIERFQRNGIGAAMASIVGFITLIIAHHLAMGGDTLEMMRAVLDSNFWLATHVVIITFGYSAMFLAGALAIFFIGMGLFRRDFDNKAARSLNSIIYGVICFAALFSLVGTILGGIWGDQSWGRFWGWDPKENGALMIVLMAAIYLHARWGGVCRERGLMNLAICGNIVTAWSWFGTNLLGVGLHSYGFTDSGFYWICLFVASQVLFMLLCAIPLRFWRSQFGQSRSV